MTALAGLFAALLLLFVGVSIGRGQAAGAWDAGYAAGHADGMAQATYAAVSDMRARNAAVKRAGLCTYAVELCRGDK